MVLRNRWKIAAGISLLLHSMFFAVVGAFWPKAAERFHPPVYVELTMGEPVSPEAKTDGGSFAAPEMQPESAAADRNSSDHGEGNRSGVTAGSSATAAAGPARGTAAAGSLGGGVPGGAGTGAGQGSGSGAGTGPTRGPQVVDSAKPGYPDNARSKGWEGTVRLQILVGEKGQVEEVKVFASSGYAELDQAALRAVRSWRFSPALQNGRTVRAWATLPVVFDLR